MDLLRSLPLGLYLEQPTTWLHRLDPRVKLAWLMTFLLTPLLASLAWRATLVAVLILLTLLAAIPLRVWRQQIGMMLAFAGLLLAISLVVPDSLKLEQQPRRPASGFIPVLPYETSGDRGPITPAPPLPQPMNYRYVLFRVGPHQLTRRSLDLGIRLSTLFFTLLYSTNLYLLTTAPEEITAGLEELLDPLRRFRWPVTEISLTLTLALRFIPLVLEEVQNLARSVKTRAINWRRLGWRGSLRIWMFLAERLLKNLLLRAEQTAHAMEVRGFTTPDQHRVQWHRLSLSLRDWIALACLLVMVGLRVGWGGV